MNNYRNIDYTQIYRKVCSASLTVIGCGAGYKISDWLNDFWNPDLFDRMASNILVGGILGFVGYKAGKHLGIFTSSKLNTPSKKDNSLDSKLDKEDP